MPTPLINGVNYSTVTVNNIAFGVPVTGISAINYRRKRVSDNNYTLGQEPASIGEGQITYEGSITVYKDWWQSVINASPNKDPFQIAPFNWTITYGDLNTPLTIETLQNVRFLEDGIDIKSGDTKLLIDIPFIWAGLLRVL